VGARPCARLNRGKITKSHIIGLAALAAIGLLGGAFAGEATKPTQMTEERMDNVTAGVRPEDCGFEEAKKTALRKMTYGMWVLTTGKGDDLEGSSVT
jgi:hypothetical protein